jgi:hypothetical protein
MKRYNWLNHFALSIGVFLFGYMVAEARAAEIKPLIATKTDKAVTVIPSPKVTKTQGYVLYNGRMTRVHLTTRKVGSSTITTGLVGGDYVRIRVPRQRAND